MTAPKIETIQGINVGNDANSEPKTKVINFWSPKKPASRIQNSRLSKLYANNPEIEFISICTDSDEKLMKEVMNIDGVEYSNSFSYSSVDSRVFKDYGVEENPATFIISPEGKILEII